MKSFWWKRVAWLAFIWCSSVVTLGLIALLFRFLMTAAGLKA